MALAGNICIENLDTRRPDLEKLLVKQEKQALCEQFYGFS